MQNFVSCEINDDDKKPSCSPPPTGGCATECKLS